MSRQMLHLQVMQIRMRCATLWSCCRKAVIQGMSAIQQQPKFAAHRMLIEASCKYCKWQSYSTDKCQVYCRSNVRNTVLSMP